MEQASAPVKPAAPLDPDSRAWVDALSLPHGQRDAAVGQLHAYLVRVARFELTRRRVALGHPPLSELDDLAVQTADDALVAILRKISSYRGDSRFTTWAAKFAILEASVKARRRAWQDKEITLDPDAWERVAATSSPADTVEHTELLHTIGEGIETALSAHQRAILVAIALNDVPIDILADRLHTTRGAIYKTLHDARRNLRIHLSRSEAP